MVTGDRVGAGDRWVGARDGGGGGGGGPCNRRLLPSTTTCPGTPSVADATEPQNATRTRNESRKRVDMVMAVRNTNL